MCLKTSTDGLVGETYRYYGRALRSLVASIVFSSSGSETEG
jgi:hypothetical protein